MNYENPIGLKEVDAGGSAGGNLRLGPYGGLDFTDVSLLEKIHAETALAYSPAYRIGKFSFDKRLMEII